MNLNKALAHINTINDNLAANREKMKEAHNSLKRLVNNDSLLLLQPLELEQNFKKMRKEQKRMLMIQMELHQVESTANRLWTSSLLSYAEADDKNEGSGHRHLHDRGFVIFRNFFSKRETTRLRNFVAAELFEGGWEILFNREEKLSAKSASETKRAQKGIDLEKLNEMVPNLGDRVRSVLCLKSHELKAPVAINSDAGCLEQLPHFDYEDGGGGAAVPVSMLIVYRPGTKLVVWELPRNGVVQKSTRQDLEFEVGDLVAWHGQLVHAGGGYIEQHDRIHAYLEPQGLGDAKAPDADSATPGRFKFKLI